jgi:hypothetical protein
MKSLSAAIVLIFLASSASFAAATKVTLATDTSPGTGQAGVGYVSVVGSGFPSGTINPTAVTLTLTPPTGTAESTKAAKVKVISGSEESIIFEIPTTILVATPTVYAVSLQGETTTGNKFVNKKHIGIDG